MAGPKRSARDESPQPPATRRPLSIGQAARLAWVSTTTVARWCDDGLIPAFRLPGSADRRIHPADLDAFLIARGMFRVLATLTVSCRGELLAATVHERPEGPVGRLACPGSPPGGGWDWRPGEDARVEVKAGAEEAVAMLRAWGFVFEDGR